MNLPLRTEGTPNDLITTTAACHLLGGIHLRSLYRWIHHGRLRSWKVVGRVRVSRAEVLALAELRPAGSPRARREDRRRRSEEAMELLRKRGYKIGPVPSL